jgi:predicted membrane channel-forming protein YqfA (hemolysin III family)
MHPTEFTEEQKMGFQATFAARRRSHVFAIGVAIAAAIGVAATVQENASALLGISPSVWRLAAVAVIVVVVVYNLVNWRCPACNAYLGRNVNPTFCPKCGTQLRA